MSGGLRPWLGERLESELETAVDYWAEGADTRANNPSSQQLEEVFENDGSNLRLKVYMSAIERPLAQIVKVRTHRDPCFEIQTHLSLVHAGPRRCAYRSHNIRSQELN